MNAEYRRIRDENAVAAITTRLPVLERKIEALRHEIGALRRKRDSTKDKHQRELVDNEIVALYRILQPLDCDYVAGVNMLARLQSAERNAA